MAAAARPAAAESVVNDSRAASTLRATNASRPGSNSGTVPFCNCAILAVSLSMHVTTWPKSEKQAPDTRPTYPVQIIAIRITKFPNRISAVTVDALLPQHEPHQA